MARTRLAWWIKVSLIFLLGRAISTAMLLVLASQQAENAWTGAQPSLWDFSSMWDGRWYNIIAEVGYPTQLPVTEDGHIAENAWAFMPVYPALVRGVMVLTGLPWNIAAIIITVVCAYVATLVFYKLLTRFVPAQQALFAVLLFSVAPVSPLFQLAYAESMQLMLIVIALYLLVRRKYAWMIPVVLVLSVTRPGSLAIALTLVLHWIYRATQKARFLLKEKVLVAAVALIAAFSGVVWLFIAGAVTGMPTAYLETELAWRSAYIGYQELVPFTPWIFAAQWWTTNFGYPEVAGYVLLAALVIGFVIFLFTPAMKRLGVDIRFWLISYALYLLAVFFPQSSTFRLLAPLFPALGAVAAPKSKVYRVTMTVLFIALQWGWLLICWRIDGYDWSPP
ncbi:hypothetical protein [Aurantimicrobium minutum]|uniref:Integral membrane protein n=1 Tax=Aurantimicrobium minutum TaxID=708131 RepID=A0A173LX48_9MICO|nr:hypothetical protein [Aurantimicrobium minutum]BAU99424.1 Uncharacterized protein AUMI_18820 [Aurantimicrobium minutum]